MWAVISVSRREYPRKDGAFFISILSLDVYICENLSVLVLPACSSLLKTVKHLLLFHRQIKEFHSLIYHPLLELLWNSDIFEI